MARLSKACLVIIGIMAISIGALHLYAHFDALITDEIRQKLSFSVPVTGSSMDVFRAWQGFSFMMGVSFIAIGLLSASHGVSRKLPSPLVFLSLIPFLAAVIYSGIYYFGDKQTIGGCVGLVIVFIGLIARARHNSDRLTF